MSRRDDILFGFQSAERINRQHNHDRRYITKAGNFDVFGLAADLDIPVMRRELDGLLGAYVPSPAPGILLNTKRPNSVQRLTCAHELGHYFLNHESSFDGEGDIGFAIVDSNRGASHEAQADAFAFSLLMPKWLITENIRKLNQPFFAVSQKVYQLSLRLGCSYEATVNALYQYKMITGKDVSYLRGIEPRTIKQSLVGGVAVDNWRRDVWVVTDLEDGSAFDVMKGDLIVLRVKEASSSGFLTSYALNGKKGVFVASGHRHMDFSGEVYNSENGNNAGMNPIGGFSIFEVVSSVEDVGEVAVDVFQGRPWMGSENQKKVMDVLIDSSEIAPGLSLIERRRMAQRFEGVA